jgi:4-hydroxyphenylpyruvate dioxygenase
MKCMSTQPIVAPSETRDFMPLHGIDHVELYVGNALQAAHYWTRALGFTEVAYAGLETGCATGRRTCSSRGGSASC